VYRGGVDPAAHEPGAAVSRTLRILALMTSFVGCYSYPVMLVAPAPSASGDCFTACEAAFGQKPTLNCGEREKPAPSLICSYDTWPPGFSPTDAEADTCRAECEQAGVRQVEAYRSLTTKDGSSAVACQQRVGYH